MKTIYLNFLIVLMATTASCSYLHAENYPSGSPIEGDDNNTYQQESNNIQSAYPGNNNQIVNPYTTDTLSAAKAANDALRRRVTMTQNPQGIPRSELPNNLPIRSYTRPTNQTMPPPRMTIPPLPQFFQNMNSPPAHSQSPNFSAPVLNANAGEQSNNAQPVENQKCHIVCGQYSNYIYATLISSIAQSSSAIANDIMQKVTKFTRGQIQSKAQCTAESLTPHLSGKNILYSKERFFPGMPKPKLFYSVCKKQCLSGKDGIIFKRSNPVIIELMRQYDFTHGKKEDKALALIAASGSGGFEDEVITAPPVEKKKATPSKKKKQKFRQPGVTIKAKRKS